MNARNSFSVEVFSSPGYLEINSVVGGGIIGGIEGCAESARGGRDTDGEAVVTGRDGEAAAALATEAVEAGKPSMPSSRNCST